MARDAKLVRDSDIAIVGGSMAGCVTALAIAAKQAETKVRSITIFERSTVSLTDRGLGIGLPAPLKDLLTESGFLAHNYRFVTCKKGRQRKTRNWQERNMTTRLK